MSDHIRLQLVATSPSPIASPPREQADSVPNDVQLRLALWLADVSADSAAMAAQERAVRPVAPGQEPTESTSAKVTL